MDDVKLAEALSDHKHRIGSLEHRMDKAENLIEEIRSMSSSIQLLAQEVQKQGEKVDSLVGKVEKTEEAPAKAWSNLKTVIITAITAGIISAAMAAIISII